MPRNTFRALIVAASALALSSPSTALAQTRDRPVAAASTSNTDPLHQAGRNVTVSLLTMGNGTQVWELFGHNAI